MGVRQVVLDRLRVVGEVIYVIGDLLSQFLIVVLVDRLLEAVRPFLDPV